MKTKFVKKYMRLAKQVGEDGNPCYSRQLGCILVKAYDDGRSRIISTGYNGPPRNTPHCDSPEYLEKIVWPQLTSANRRISLSKIGIRTEDYFTWDEMDLDEQKKHFLEHYSNCKECPRRIIQAGTGERTELCSCEHAERNAIYNSTEDLQGVWAFCWCGVPCWDCAKALINSGIKKVFIKEDTSYARNGGKDYSHGVRELFRWSGIELVSHPPDYYLSD